MLILINLSYLLMLLISLACAKRNVDYIILLIFTVYYGAFFIISPNISTEELFSRYSEEFFLILMFNVGFVFSSLIIFTQVFTQEEIQIGKDSDQEFYAQRIRKASLIFYGFCVLITMMFFVQNGIPWLSDDVEGARHANRGSGYISMFRNRGLPISSIIFVVLTYHINKKFFCKPNVIIIFATIFLLMLGAFRTYALLYIISLFVAWTVIVGKLYISRSAAIFVLALALFSILTIAKLETDDPLMLLGEALRHRVAFELIWTIGYSRQIFEGTGPWYGWTYMMDLYSALPGPGMSFGDYLINFVDPYSPIAGVAALTPSIVGESYLNFGTVGVLIVGFLHPIIYFTAISTFRRARLLAPAFLATFGLYLTQAVEVGFGGVMASRFAPSIVMYCLIFAIASMTKVRRTVTA